MSSGSHSKKHSDGFLKNAVLILLLVVLLAVLAILVNKLRTAEPAKYHPSETVQPALTFTPTVQPTATPAARCWASKQLTTKKRVPF